MGEQRRVGGGLLIASGVLSPMVVQMSGLSIPHGWGYPLLGLCALVGLLGLWLAFAPERETYSPDDRPPYEIASASHGLIGCSITLLLLGAGIFATWLYWVMHGGG